MNLLILAFIVAATILVMLFVDTAALRAKLGMTGVGMAAAWSWFAGLFDKWF